MDKYNFLKYPLKLHFTFNLTLEFRFDKSKHFYHKVLNLCN